MLDYQAIIISGKDAEVYLQGQVSCDVTEAKQVPILGCCCNLQGRVQFIFNLFYANEQFVMWLPRSVVEIALARLKQYAIFSKVSFTVADIEENQQPELFTKLLTSYRIQHLIPEIYAETSALFLPQELNLDQLNALNFKKGCYTGQEIVARIHYRGAVKQHLYRVKNNQINSNFKPGDKIYDAKKNQVGLVIDSYLEQLLIILRDEQTHNLNNLDII